MRHVYGTGVMNRLGMSSYSGLAFQWPVIKLLWVWGVTADKALDGTDMYTSHQYAILNLHGNKCKPTLLHCLDAILSYSSMNTLSTALNLNPKEKDCLAQETFCSLHCHLIGFMFLPLRCKYTIRYSLAILALVSSSLAPECTREPIRYVSKVATGEQVHQ